MEHLVDFPLGFRWPADFIFFLLAAALTLGMVLSRDRLKTAGVLYVLCIVSVDVPGTYYSGCRMVTLLGLAVLGLAAALAADPPALGRAARQGGRFLSLLAAFCIWCLVGLAVNADSPTEWGYSLRLGGLGVTAGLLSLLSHRREVLFAMGRVFVIAMALISLIAIVQFVWGEFVWGIGRTVEADYPYFIQVGRGIHRAPGLFVDPNNMGIFCAVALLLLFGRFGPGTGFREEGKIPAAAGLSLTAGLLFSLTRTAVAALAIGLAILTPVRMLKPVFVVALLLVLGGVFFFRGHQNPEYVLRPPPILGARLSYWKAALDIGARSPVWGVGLGRFGREIEPEAAALDFKTTRLDDHRPHNIFLGLLAETGWGGLAMFAALLGVIGIPLARRSGRPERVCLGLLAAVIFHANLHNVLIQDLLWATIGIAAAVKTGGTAGS